MKFPINARVKAVIEGVIVGVQINDDGEYEYFIDSNEDKIFEHVVKESSLSLSLAIGSGTMVLNGETYNFQLFKKGE